MYLLLLLVFVSTALAAFEFKQFNADYFFKESFTSPETELKPTLDPLTCGIFCDGINQDSCSSYVNVLSERHCQVIADTQSLVRTDPASPNAVKIWTAEAVTTVPHFLLFATEFFGDYSSNAEISPALTSYMGFPEFSMPCGMYLQNEMKLVIRSRTSGVFYEWTHGHEELVQSSSNDPVTDRNSAACAASPSSGKLFFYSGGEYGKKTTLCSSSDLLEFSYITVTTAFLYDRGKAKNFTTTQGLLHACAVFHPLDDNIVYVFGGRSPSYVKTAFKFFLDGTEQQSIRDMDSVMGYQGGVGFVKPGGSPAILLAGGWNGFDSTNQVLEYDIPSNTYSMRPPLLSATYAPTLLKVGNYFYAFGGGGTKSVSRLEKSMTLPWEEMSPMPVRGHFYNMAVVPYNL